MLAAEDQLEAALALERMWNDPVSAHPFALVYCAYPIHLFANEALGAAFLHLCDDHDDVIPVATSLASPARHGRCLAVLQQQAGALRAEIADAAGARRGSTAC